MPNLYKEIKNRAKGLLALTVSNNKGAVIVPILIWGGASLVTAVLGFLGAKLILTTTSKFIVALVTTFLQIPLAISAALFGLSVSILGVVTNPNFISLSYTGLDNFIIKEGWSLTRDLANMGIVIVFVIIGLATILKIESYHAKRTLLPLIVIALLINFTPVILGLVVDASNIIMNYFLKDFSSSIVTMGDLIGTGVKDVGNAWSNVVETEVSVLTPLARTIALTIFSLVAAIILATFSLLFVARYIAIWILVILSPLAFIFYIFPGTKGFFHKWRDSFIQWCFIGVVAAFFLYLTTQMIGHQGELMKEGFTIPSTGEAKVLTGLMNQLLPFGLIITFLIIAFMSTVSISAMGSGAIINLTKKWGAKAKGMPRWIKEKSLENVKPLLADKLKLRERAGAITQVWEKAPIARWFLPQKLRQYSQYRPAVDEAQKQLSYLSSKDLGRMLWAGVFKGVQKTAALKELASRGDTQDLFEEGKRRFHIKTKGPEGDMELLRKPKAQKTLGRMTEMSLFSGYHNYILRRDPRLGAAAAHAGLPGYLYPEEVETRKQKRDFLKSIEKLPKEEREKKWKELEEKGMEKASSEMRAKHLPDVEREVAENKVVVEKWMERGREMLEPAGRTLKRGVATIQKTMNEIFSEYVDEVLQKELPGLAQDIKQKAETVEGLAKDVKEGQTEKIPELGKAREELKAMSAAQNIKQKVKTVEGLAKDVKEGQTEKIPELGKAREELKAMSANVWDIQFRNWYRKKHSGKEGIFKYVGTQRATEEGWEKGEYLLPEDRYPEKAKTAAVAIGGVERTEPPTIAGAGVPPPERPQPPTVGAGGKAADKEREQPKTVLQKRVKKKI